MIGEKGGIKPWLNQDAAFCAANVLIANRWGVKAVPRSKNRFGAKAVQSNPAARQRDRTIAGSAAAFRAACSSNLPMTKSRAMMESGLGNVSSGAEARGK